MARVDRRTAVAEVALKPDQIIKSRMVVKVRPANWGMRASAHERHLTRVSPSLEVEMWMQKHVRKGWVFRKKTTSILFKDADEAFHFRMRW